VRNEAEKQYNRFSRPLTVKSNIDEENCTSKNLPSESTAETAEELRHRILAKISKLPIDQLQVLNAVIKMLTPE